jgi:hypothetical protein
VDEFSFKKADNFIENDSRDLQTVYTKIHMLDMLNQKIQSHLEPGIAKFCQVANLVNGKLILIAANGSIATQLRFQSGDLLRKFRQDPMLKSILSIECKVRPAQNQLSSRLAEKTPKSMPGLSQQTAEIVNTIAESIEDPALREVMTRIAKRVKLPAEQGEGKK